MFYHEYPAPPALGEHIQCFWTLEHDYRDSFHTHEHLWADTQIELIFSYGERYYQKKGRGRNPLPANFVIGPFKKELLLAREIKSRKGVVKISELTTMFGLNPRRLERLFINEIGMSAKLFARILRFNHAKGLIESDPDISLASLTYETGYADQAHFSRNFREMFGCTPAQFKMLMRNRRQKSADQEKDVVFLQDNP